MRAFLNLAVAGVLTICHAFAGETEVVLSCYRQALELGSGSPLGRAALCRNAKSDSHTRAAIDCYRLAQDLPGSPTDWGNLCTEVRSSSETQAVIGCYKQTLHLPGNFESKAQLCSKVKS